MPRSGYDRVKLDLLSELRTDRFGLFEGKVRLGQVSSGGDLVVSVLAFYSDDPRSNPAGNLKILYEKTK